MKTFSLEFLCFPGLDVTCKLCNEPIEDRQEETVVPALYYDKDYVGPICKTCYVNLPERVKSARLQRFEG